MRANGATINLVNCSDMAPHACEGLGYEEAEYFTQTSLGYMVDESGVLLGDREQNLCLLGNVKLEKTLVIPVGMSVNLCLNGFTLTSPNIVWGHEGKPDECCTAIQVMPGASLTICDCSATQSGRVTVNYNPTPMGWGALGASAVLNYGSFTLKSGTLVGTMALLNAGDTVIKDGSIVGLLVGVAQGVQVTEDIGTDRTPTFVMENGEVHSMGLGVVGVEGEIVMNKGEITAQIAGIGTGIDVENPEGNAILYLNSGVINVGRIEAKAYIAAGLPVNENGESELKVSSDMCVGVVVSTTLVLGGDVVINIEGPLAEVASTTAEILMADGAILKSNKDSVIENFARTNGSNAVII